MDTVLRPVDARRLRLANHGLLASRDDTPTSLLDRVVALQGQDVRAVMDAIALRVGTDAAAVRAAFDRGDLVRSWPMRATLFATTPGHLANLLSLTSERVLAGLARRRANLGIDDATIATARTVALERLADGPLRRADLLSAWEEAGLEPRGGLGYHLILHLAVTGLVHWGPFDGDEQLLVAATRPVDHHGTDPDLLLAQVIRGYLSGRSPATVDDLAWWLKLPKWDVRRGVDAAGMSIAEVDVDGTPMLVLEDALHDLDVLPPIDDGQVVLLPAFDEYYLGYRDRALVAAPGVGDVVVPGRNGVFRPLVVVNGQVVGTWRRTRTGAELTGLVDVPASTRRAVEAALADVRPGRS